MKKLICGPMATISHPAFRILVEKFGGCDEYFTEMINAGSLLTNGPFEKYYIDSTPVPQKLVWQLTGHNVNHMKEAASMLCDLPALGLDINMGCSAPDIYKSGAGIGWMLKPIDETMHMVKTVSDVIANKNSKMRFSVKLRLGDDDFTDEKFYTFANELVNNGVQLLTLHPRTKKEKLCRPPRYTYCQNLASLMKEKNVEVYLNGNVKDSASFNYATSQSPDCSGVMIARASVQKPWIFSELCSLQKKEDNVLEQQFTIKKQIDMQELCFEYIELVEKYQPQEFWKTRLQRFFTYFCQNFTFAHYAQTQFVNAQNNEDLRKKIEEFFIKCPEERLYSI